MLKILKESSYEDRCCQYDEYLFKHIGGVQRAFEDYLVDYLITERGCTVEEIEALRTHLKSHDKSKYNDFEYNAYLDHFYPKDGSSSKEESPEFQRAWLNHQKSNPHHWQHWIVINDSPDGEGKVKFTPVDMDFKYIIEMLCDWSSFQYQGKGTANEWYSKIKSFILLSPKTREVVEEILSKCPGL